MTVIDVDALTGRGDGFARCRAAGSARRRHGRPSCSCRPRDTDAVTVLAASDGRTVGSIRTAFAPTRIATDAAEQLLVVDDALSGATAVKRTNLAPGTAIAAEYYDAEHGSILPYGRARRVAPDRRRDLRRCMDAHAAVLARMDRRRARIAYPCAACTRPAQPCGPRTSTATGTSAQPSRQAMRGSSSRSPTSSRCPMNMVTVQTGPSRCIGCYNDGRDGGAEPTASRATLRSAMR